MNEKGPLFGRDQLQDISETLVDRQTRKYRRSERRLAEQRTTKHLFAARKSCVSDARNYRIAREFPMSAAAQLDWKKLIPPRPPFLLIGIAWLRKFRDEQLKPWLGAKHAS